jgi:hypothetical protein
MSGPKYEAGEWTPMPEMYQAGVPVIREMIRK